jgi:hypothetical protein
MQEFGQQIYLCVPAARKVQVMDTLPLSGQVAQVTSGSRVLEGSSLKRSQLLERPRPSFPVIAMI